MARALRHAGRLLGREIENRLRAGIFLSSDSLSFMASTFSIENAADFRSLLDASDDSDAQTLLELLFTPEDETRVDLEEIISESSFTNEDEKALIAGLHQKKLDVPLHFPGAAAGVLHRPSRHLLAAWVRSLKITVRLPEKLLNTIDHHTPGRLGTEIKVRLRHARLHLNRPVCSFLDRFLEKRGLTGEALLRDLDLCLAIFSERLQSGATSPYDLFMVKKRGLLAELQQAERFEKELAGNNIETLILKGVRAPLIDKAAARKKIAAIDAICLSVFGLTDPLPQNPSRADLGNFRNRDDLKRAFEILS